MENTFSAGQTVICKFNYKKFWLAKNNLPLIGEPLLIAEVKGDFISFGKYNKGKQKSYFSSKHFSV